MSEKTDFKSKRLSMPSYVIIEKREFEQLFETVETEGKVLTAVNVKKKNKTEKNSRVRLRGDSEHSSKKRKRRRVENDSHSDQEKKKIKTDIPSSSEECAKTTLAKSRENSPVKREFTPIKRTSESDESDSNTREPESKFGYSSLSSYSESE